MEFQILSVHELYRILHRMLVLLVFLVNKNITCLCCDFLLYLQYFPFVNRIREYYSVDTAFVLQDLTKA